MLSSVVKVPVAPVHPRTVARAKRQRAELERLLTPKALAEIDRAERSLLTGELQQRP